MPLSYCDLPRNAILAITVYDCAGPRRKIPVGGTTVSLFGKHGVFRQVCSKLISNEQQFTKKIKKLQGILDLQVWPDQVADGSLSNATPGKGGSGRAKVLKLGKVCLSICRC